MGDGRGNSAKDVNIHEWDLRKVTGHAGSSDGVCVGGSLTNNCAILVVRRILITRKAI